MERRRLGVDRIMFPLTLVASILAHGIINPKTKEVGLHVSDRAEFVFDQVQRVMEEREMEGKMSKLEEKLSPEERDVLRETFYELDQDKKARRDALQAREAEANKLLVFIAGNYASMDLRETTWKLEYFFQGVSDEDYREAQYFLDSKLSTLKLHGQSYPTPSDLHTFHEAFVSRGPRDELKSSAVEFLASHCDPTMQNCDAAARTLLLAFLTRYPLLRNSVYYHFFRGHRRFVLDLEDQKYVFKWEDVARFPDEITDQGRSALVPVDVYYALSGGRVDQELLSKIQYFGPEPDPDELEIPIYTNTLLPRFQFPYKLGTYPGPSLLERKALKETIKKTKNKLEYAKNEMLAQKVLAIPPVSEFEHKQWESFQGGKFLYSSDPSNPNLSMFSRLSYYVLVRLDQVEVADLEQVLKNPLLENSTIIFSGKTAISEGVMRWIADHLYERPLVFLDLKEITAVQLAKLFESGNSVADQRSSKVVTFFDLEHVRGAPPPSDLVEFDLVEVQKVQPSPSKQVGPGVDYRVIDLTFHRLHELSPEAADWLGRRSGLVTFGVEANLPPRASSSLVPFKGEITLENPYAHGLLASLQKHQHSFNYNSEFLSPEMGKAMIGYEGELTLQRVTTYYQAFDLLSQRTRRTSFQIHRPENELYESDLPKILRAISTMKGPIKLGFRRIVPPDVFLPFQNHQGDVAFEIMTASDQDLIDTLRHLGSIQGTLGLNLIHANFVPEGEKVPGAPSTKSPFSHPEVLDILRKRTAATRLKVYLGDLHFMQNFSAPLVLYLNVFFRDFGYQDVKKLTQNHFVTAYVHRSGLDPQLYHFYSTSPKPFRPFPNVQIEPY